VITNASVQQGFCKIRATEYHIKYIGNVNRLLYLGSIMEKATANRTAEIQIPDLRIAHNVVSNHIDTTKYFMSLDFDNQKKTTLLAKTVITFQKIVVPILLTLLLFWTYKIIACFLSDKSSTANFLCTFKWKDGLFLVISYSIVKSLSILLGFDTIFKTLVVTLLLYSFLYGLFAFPFWFASFFQPLLTNTLLHIFIIILTIEIIFSKE